MKDLELPDKNSMAGVYCEWRSNGLIFLND